MTFCRHLVRIQVLSVASSLWLSAYCTFGALNSNICFFYCADYLHESWKIWSIVWFHFGLGLQIAQHTEVSTAFAKCTNRIYLPYYVNLVVIRHQNRIWYKFRQMIPINACWRLVSGFGRMRHALACQKKQNNKIYRFPLYVRIGAWLDRDKIESTWRSIEADDALLLFHVAFAMKPVKLRRTYSVDHFVCMCAPCMDYLQFMESEQMQYITNGHWRRWQQQPPQHRCNDSDDARVSRRCDWSAAFAIAIRMQNDPFSE